MLTDGMLDFYRDTLKETYPDTCVIVRSQGSADGMGGSTVVDVAAGTYACRIAPAGMPPFEVLTARQVQGVEVMTITFPALVDIRPSDKIQSGPRVYSVTGGSTDRSWELSKRVTATATNEGAV